MLPKKERLSRSEFNRFFSVGKRLHTPLFTMVYVPDSVLHASVVVPKKVSTKAVVRNKIRRQIYDIVRQHRSRLRTQGVFIFLVKPAVGGASYEMLKKEVVASISKTQAS